MSDTTKKAFQTVTAFIDWNAQIRSLTKKGKMSNSVEVAERVLSKTARVIAKSLVTLCPGEHFRVSLRVYHGWHKGFQPSANHVALKHVLGATEFTSLSPKVDVVFAAPVEFGDRLLFARAERLHVRPPIHLPNTLRDREKRKGLEEKMVDTAIAADLIASAFQYPEDWILVLAEDDDLVPPLFTAEMQVAARGGRVLLLSHRQRNKNFLKLDGIILEAL